MFDIINLKKSIQNVGDQANELRQSIEEKKRRRDYLETAPLTRKELADNVCEMVDKQGNEFPERLGKALEGLQYKPHFDFASSNLELVNNVGGSSVANTIPKINMYWFFADQIKERLCDAIDLMQWPEEEAGPALAERKIEIEKLDKEINKLENQLQELRQSAEQAGVHIERVDSNPERQSKYIGGRPLHANARNKP